MSFSRGAKTNLSVHLSDRIAEIAVAQRRNELSEEVFQISQALILCGLPYAPTKESSITRKARLANGSWISVTFSTTQPGKMPFGSDRCLLFFLLDKAVKDQSRFVAWETASEYLEAMKLAPGGTNRRATRERFERIRRLMIYVERSGISSSYSEMIPMIRRANLPESLVRRDGRSSCVSPDKGQFGIELDEGFFKELQRHHVPVPREIVSSMRKQSQLQDMVLFLYWRCYAAESASVIPWQHLLQQIWHADSNKSRIKARFARAIEVLHCMWPEMQAESRKDGLWVGPSRNGIQFTPSASAARKLRNRC